MPLDGEAQECCPSAVQTNPDLVEPPTSDEDALLDRRRKLSPHALRQAELAREPPRAGLVRLVRPLLDEPWVEPVRSPMLAEKIEDGRVLSRRC